MTLPAADYQARTARAQARMAKAGLDALLLTTEAGVRYFTGFLTRFWQSPTRPWFVIVPAAGKPVPVIPEIGAAPMARGWITDIRTWPAPRPADDGVTLLADTLRELCGPNARIGLPMGHETHLRMPLADFDRLRNLVAPATLTDDAGILRALRLVKSEAEIALVRQACAIAARAFARLPEIAQAGTPLSDVFRRFQMLCLEEGADWVPYLAGAAGPSGYSDVISPATETPLAPGDVLMLDTGLVHQGYFCDFDRNVAIGRPNPAVADAHARLIEATRAGFDTARPGATAAELCRAMAAVIGETGNVGRLGHGLGMELTEAPSLTPDDETELLPGMVLTLEPGIALPGGRMLVHEENIVIRDTGAEWLSDPAGPDMPVIEV